MSIHEAHRAGSNLILLTISLRQACSTERRSASNTTCSYTSAVLRPCVCRRGGNTDEWTHECPGCAVMMIFYNVLLDCCPTALKQWITCDSDGIKQYVLIINNMIIYQVLLGFHLLCSKCHKSWLWFLFIFINVHWYLNVWGL